MIGTPEERFQKRQARLIAIRQRNGGKRAYGAVQPGTTALLEALRKQSGLSMDKLLYKLARLGQRYGV
jgi:hypothetical protein